MRKVAVFFGGRSCENEISVLTGVFVLNVLDREKYIIFPVYVHTDGKTYTSEKMFSLSVFREKKFNNFRQIFFDGGSMYEMNEKKCKIRRLAKIDVAINCCHGGLGEGGGVSAMMEWNQIPLASPDLTASGIFMDKCTTKLFAKGLGIPVLDYIRVNEGDYAKRGAFLLRSIESRLKYPVVIKPAHLGSSIGIAVAKNEADAKRSLQAAFRIDDRVLIEKYLPQKKDVNCAAYMRKGEIILSEPEVTFGDGVYTFEEKYVKRRQDGLGVFSDNGGGRCALNDNLRSKIRAYTKTLYKRMNLCGVVRIDFLVSGEEVYLCEVNTIPGSLAYYFFCERVTDGRRFFGDLLEEAIEQGALRPKKLLSSGILRTAIRPKK